MPKEVQQLLEKFYESPAAYCAEKAISIPTFHRRVQRGEVKTIKFGTTRLILREDAAD
jgi:hypothetical protein